MKTRRVMISGKVQGVGFRHWTCQQAGQLGLAGWVRNRSSGDVEACFTGENNAVEIMLDRLWKGPGFSKVTAVTLLEGEGDAAGPVPEMDFVRLETL
ncbi:acylphosphatase [Kiloniella sp. b19]|uniref:acylphosphatase n=1 Tax=Kiloniella sp. GXU_MW_B19 TaxID=3141326 RepID=UPI0031D7F3D8